MAHVPVTGMSGVGKSTALRLLAALGYQTVSTDDLGWCVPEPGVPDSDWLWDESKMATLFSEPRERHLFVDGTRENQGQFYDRFEAVCVLTAPPAVVLHRLAHRTTNPYGKSVEQQRLVLEQIESVEPLVIRTATHVIETTVPPDEVVAQLVAIANSSDSI